jgi:hypothetical protein
MDGVSAEFESDAKHILMRTDGETRRWNFVDGGAMYRHFSHFR